MHYFESQLVSTTKVVEQNDEQIVFSGHYLYGDGASALCIPLVALIFCAGIYFTEDEVGTRWFFTVTVICLPLFLHGLLFRKRTELRTDNSGALIETRTLLAKSKKEYPSSQLQLEVAHIHIRLASDCGAIDLVLPDGKIRLLFKGKYERALQQAEELSEFTGIVLARPPKA